MLVGTEAEVLESLTAVLGATENQGVAAGRGSESELIESDGFSASSSDASTCSGSEAKSSNCSLRESKESVVVSNSSDNNDGSLLALLGNVGHNSRQRDGWSVNLGHEKASEDNLVEGSVGTTCRRSCVSNILLNGRNLTYGQGSGKALPGASSRHCRSWAPCGECP